MLVLFFDKVQVWILGLSFAHIILAFQVVLNNVCIVLKDATPISLLKDKVRQVEGNPDFTNMACLNNRWLVKSNLV